MKRVLLGMSVFLVACVGGGAGQFDTASYHERGVTVQDGMLEQIGKKPGDASSLELEVDLGDRWIPTSPSQFAAAWHHPPVCQDLTGACWSFAGTSFLESEIARQAGRQLKLSEMYFVYWESVAKAREFIHTRGTSRFSRGGQGNAVLRLVMDHGAVPIDVYGAVPDGALYQDAAMFREMEQRLDRVRVAGDWDETKLLADIRAILDRHLGTPPERFDFEGKSVTPQEFLREVCQVRPEEYVDVMSLMQFPWGAQESYPVADNWWHAPYRNVPLGDFLAIFNSAAKQGFTICMAGDISGPGYLPRHDVAMVPTFDIPSGAINDAARQLRFDDGTSSDDHAIQMVGYMDHAGERWYLVKDSYPSARDGQAPGYMFYSEDYVALKMLNITVHRDALPPGVAKLKN